MKQPRRFRKPLVILCAIIALLILIPIGLYGWQEIRIRSELSKIRSAGEPLEAAEFFAMQPVPANGNDVTERLNELKITRWAKNSIWSANGIVYEMNPGSIEFKPPLPGAPWPSEQNATRILSIESKPLQIARELLHETSYISVAPPQLLQEYSQISISHSDKPLAWLLAVDILDALHKRDARRCAHSLTMLFQLGQLYERAWTTKMHSERLAIDDLAIRLLETALNHQIEFVEEELVRFERAIKQRNYKAELKRDYLVARALMLKLFDDPMLVDPSMNRVQQAVWLNDNREAKVEYLRFSRKIVESMGKPWHECTAEMREVVQSQRPKIDHTQRNRWLHSVVPPPVQDWRSGFGINMIGSLGIQKHAMAVARASQFVCAAEVGLAVFRFQKKNRRLPNDLAELVPEFLEKLPVDPLSGNPFETGANPQSIFVQVKDSSESSAISQTEGENKYGPLFGIPNLTGSTKQVP